MAQIKEEIYYSPKSHRLFLDEQKGCCKETGRIDLLFIYQRIIKDSKTRRKRLSTAWIDYKKTFHIVPESRIIDSLNIQRHPTKS